MALANSTPDAPIRVSLEGSIAVITLNRPERYNALTAQMLHDLGAAFAAAGQDPDVRVIVMLAEGRAFCAGADAGGLEESAYRSIEEQLQEPMPQFTPRHVGIFKPVICAINGICAGAGLHFVADSDIVIASDNATFTDSHVNIGQVSALEPIGLARRMPMGAVLRMVLLGNSERMPARRAYELGMISEITAPEELRPRAMAIAATVAGMSPEAVQLSLKAVWESLEMPLTEAYSSGYESLVRHRAHPDASEGPRAFMGKRPPAWSAPNMRAVKSKAF